MFRPMYLPFPYLGWSNPQSGPIIEEVVEEGSEYEDQSPEYETDANQAQENGIGDNIFKKLEDMQKLLTLQAKTLQHLTTLVENLQATLSAVKKTTKTQDPFEDLIADILK